MATRLAAFERKHGHRPTPVVRSKIEAQEARKERRAVAGYALVFTPVKSLSLLWALGSEHTRVAVEDAHHEAVANTLAWLEEETAFARVGDHGEQQIETRGFLAAAFDNRQGLNRWPACCPQPSKRCRCLTSRAVPRSLDRLRRRDPRGRGSGAYRPFRASGPSRRWMPCA